MRASTFIHLFLILSFSTMGFDKSVFDIIPAEFDSNEQVNTLGKIPYPGLDFLQIEYAGMEAMLLKEGFITLGTTSGADPTSLDNDEPLTYGHPFAKTSFPYLVVDGVQYRFDQYFSGVEHLFESNGDSSISLTLENGMLQSKVEISGFEGDEIEGLCVKMALRNMDSNPHDISLGFLLDPALGTWGDGALSMNGVPIESTYEYDVIGPLSGAVIDERRNFNTGTQLNIRFPLWSSPPVFMAGNWPVITGYMDETVNELYDLALQWNSSDYSLAPDSLLATEFTLHLGGADYPDGPYMRSQLPQMLDMYQGLVYPRSLRAFTSIENAWTQTYADIEITLRGNELVDEWISQPFTLWANSFSYEHVPMQFPEIFEDRVYTLELELKTGATLLDLIQHKIFIPASPYSDTGLVVLPDSILLNNYPEVSVRFSASEEASGRYLFNLENENVFVYEDQTRIYDFSLIPDTTSGNNSVDVVFVLDVTGSMGDEINGVKDNLGAFAQNLDEQGVDYRLAMVTFLDEVENIYDFTSDVNLFQTHIDAQYAHGGGDWKENSLEAIYTATQLQFRDSASREFIWITDAGYHVNTGPTTLTVEDVVDALLLNGVTCNAVSGDGIRVEYCEPITVPTGGDWFDIQGNFLDILLQISDWGGTNGYLLAYDSPNPGASQRTVGLEVHYAGLGGYGSIYYTPPAVTNLGKSADLVVSCYPNPFNPEMNIEIDVPASHTARARIYNIRGQLVQDYLLPRSGSHSLHWDATDQEGQNVSAGVYLLQVNQLSRSGNLTSQQLIKLIHIK